MIFPALLLLQQPQPAPPMLDEVLKLPAAEAGDLVLQDHAHGRIASVYEVKGQLQPPNLEQLHLVEEPVRSGAGCGRTRWTATFQAQTGRPLGEAVVTSTFGTTEIRLMPAGPCGSDDYVQVDPRLDKETGFAALEWLERIRLGTGDERFVCADETQSGLCEDADNIRRELVALQPWAVTRKNNHLELRLGTPGQVVTVVRFQPEQTELIEINRRIPAPF